MFRGLQRADRTERYHAPALDLRYREARVGAADIDRHDFGHANSSPIAANIADAPCSAPSAPWRKIANNSRPVPEAGFGVSLKSRASHSLSGTSASSWPLCADRRIMSPSRSLASGPPPLAS